MIADLADLPQNLTPPAFDESGQRRPCSHRRGGRSSSGRRTWRWHRRWDESGADAGYPASVLDGDRRETLGPSAFMTPPQFNLRGLAVPRLVRDRWSWLAYEPQTGAMLRLKVVQR